MKRDEIMRIWRSVSPGSIITEDGLRICEAIMDNALEEAAKICDGVNNHDNPMTSRDCSDAIRALKSSANGAGGQG